MIAESSYPRDFYNKALDGVSVSSLLTTIKISNDLRFVLDFSHLRKCVKECYDKKFDVLHVSSHGDENGIALADNSCPTWDEFAKLFKGLEGHPTALIMSACCGASSGIGEAFGKIEAGPAIIFGSTEPLNFSEYAVAWSILYHNFKTKGLTRSSSQTALQQMTAVVHKSFVYRRWDGEKGRYLIYPSTRKKYEIKESPLKKRAS
jgi:hypothetical protein